MADKMVKGTIFSEYIRMIKMAPDLEWSRYLTEEDLALANEVILASSWYPLETYKRLGVAVFKLMAKQDLKAAWLWGRASLDEQIRTYKNIVQPNDPLGSIRKFSGYLGRFANFDLMDVEEPGVGLALITFKMRRTRLMPITLAAFSNVSWRYRGQNQ